MQVVGCDGHDRNSARLVRWELDQKPSYLGLFNFPVPEWISRQDPCVTPSAG